MKFSLQLGSWNFGNNITQPGAAATGNHLSGSNFIPVNGFGDVIFYNLGCEREFLIAYNLCSPLKSIIGKRAKAFNNGKIEYIQDIDGNYATGSYVDQLVKLNRAPNILQSGQQFYSQQNHYIDIFGYCPVLKVKPVGMSDVTALWNIPPYLIDTFDFTGKWLSQRNIEDIYKNFSISWNGRSEPLDMKDIYFVFDDGIGTEFDTNLTIPDSRLMGLEYPISNIIAAYKSRNTLITKRGALGILTNDGKDQVGVVPLQPGEKDEVQADFNQYGLTGQPKQVIITDAALKWQQMGFATKDLMLFEEVEDDINRLCDAYGFPVELMARGKDTTFENKKYAKKDLYRGAIIPEAESRIQQNSKGIIPEDKKIRMTIDFSDIDVIQEEAEQKARAEKLKNEALAIEYENGLITKNMWLVSLGRDTVTDKTFDEYKQATAITPPSNAQ